jgi:hypothetical protein
MELEQNAYLKKVAVSIKNKDEPNATIFPSFSANKARRIKQAKLSIHQR